MNWFDRFKIAALIASVSLLTTYCVSIEATYILFIVLGVYAIQYTVADLWMRQLEIRRERNADAIADATADATAHARHARLYDMLDKESRGESLTHAEQTLLDDIRVAGTAHAKWLRKHLDNWLQQKDSI